MAACPLVGFFGLPWILVTASYASRPPDRTAAAYVVRTRSAGIRAPSPVAANSAKRVLSSSTTLAPSIGAKREDGAEMCAGTHVGSWALTATEMAAVRSRLLSGSSFAGYSYPESFDQRNEQSLPNEISAPLSPAERRREQARPPEGVQAVHDRLVLGPLGDQLAQHA